MKIVTWNVNSIRTRLNHVLDWWDIYQPDVLCLQETKVVDDDFPYELFEERGLYIYCHGQKSYNGVALISKEPLENIQTGFGGVDLENQARVISGDLNGVHVVNIYVPQGENAESPKFDFKRNFYAALQAELENTKDPKQPLVLLGDFNIAPQQRDVDDAEKRAGKCMFTEEEHGWLAMLESWGLQDALRLVSDKEGIFSWWDYRQGAFQRNRGMRIDLIYVTAPLASKIQAVEFFKEERMRRQPSDHIPVMLSLKK
ncbi:MAG: exodeoxyribonuclease III [Alphaproteobacteria bacterium]|nr:exodeoxyribonuclease III [Alphaproteobacteria bacterium]MDD9920410.1 exodeoxyribonuclease III [Alphaproteobacteria bacterium]